MKSKWPLCSVSYHLQLRNGGFRWSKILLSACSCWWQIVHCSREKMPESSTLLSTLSPYRINDYSTKLQLYFIIIHLIFWWPVLSGEPQFFSICSGISSTGFMGRVLCTWPNEQHQRSEAKLLIDQAVAWPHRLFIDRWTLDGRSIGHFMPVL